MRVSDVIHCVDRPCTDVRHDLLSVPDVDISPASVRMVLVSEAAAPRAEDGYYASDAGLFAKTTLQAFRDAGTQVNGIRELMRSGVYLTTAVKCAKTAYGLVTPTVHTCSRLLQRELDLFPRLRALLLMGDVAIKAVNHIARCAGEPRVIPPGSTFRLRGSAYFWRGVRVFPSYVQAGPSFFIETSKRRMIAEDIATALALIDRDGARRLT
ncbi:MAG: uracil-DNA glycosylase family protein [Candidatus Bipolaricaulota bacterium]